MAEENKEVTKPAQAKSSDAPKSEVGTPTESVGKKKSGGNKAMTVIIIVILVLGALGAAGYYGVRYLLNRAGEKVAEGIIESNIGGDVEYNYDEDGATLETEDGTTQVGSAAEWPSDIPSSVPKYTEGKISYTATTEEGWDVMYEEIRSSSLDSYKSSLKDKGWTIVATSNSAASGNSLQAENDTYDLYLMAFEEGKTATLSVTKKSDY